MDHSFRPGDCVTWAEPHPLDIGEEGRVIEPTATDLAYFAEQAYSAERCVLVEWSGDAWDSAWHHPRELRRVS